MGDADVRILTPAFGRLALAAFVFFIAMGATFPVLPRYVRDEIGTGDTGVGIVLGAMAIGAIVGRPFVGRFGDRRGRGLLMVMGGLLAGAAMIGLLVADSIPALLALRVLFGFGGGATMVGGTTLAVDLAPASRSGEATSYVFVALHLGNGIGALLGEWLLNTWSYDAVWIAAGACMGASSLVALSLPNVVDDGLSLDAPVGLLHPRAIVPGMILGMGAIGFIGFNGFVPLFADEIGVGDVAPYFFAASITVVIVRFFGARLPDRLGPLRGGTIALVVMTAGLLLIGGLRSGAGLAAGSVVLAGGAAMLLPSLVTAAVDGVPVTQRSRALATYTLFLEISQAFGTVLFGGVAALSSYGTAYLVAAGTSVVALAMLRTLIPRRSSTARPSPAA